MKYLIESNLGGYYITSNEEEVVKKTCGKCGETDEIVLSYDGSLKEALEYYYLKPLVADERMLFMLNEYMDYQVIENISYEYKLQLYMLNSLKDQFMLNEAEYNDLKNIILKAEKRNIKLFKEYKTAYYNDIISDYRKVKYKK